MGNFDNWTVLIGTYIDKLNADWLFSNEDSANCFDNIDYVELSAPYHDPHLSTNTPQS